MCRSAVISGKPEIVDKPYLSFMKMYLLFLLLLPAAMIAQSPPAAPQPSFFAIIVSDIDTCTQWYSELFGLEIRNQIDLPERSVRINILEGESMELELLQLPNSLPAADLLQDQEEGSQVAGFFKMGFQVDDWEGWLDFLETQKVAFHGNVVTDPQTGKAMVIIKDPEGNRLQFFEK